MPRAACSNVPLSVLKREYENEMKDVALRRLSKRSKVTIDAEFLHTQDEEDLFWDTSTHHLDFFMVVSGIKGLHAIIPRSTTDLSYTFRLDLNQRHRLWRAKRAYLGFSPKGRMLFIGQFNQEQVWLAMVPRSFTYEDLDEDAERILDEESNMAKLGAKTSSLTEAHYCMLVLFLAKSLHKIGYKDIVLRDDYPVDLTVDYLRQKTNLL